jgi:hypothetical protein
LMEETAVPGENHRPATSHWQTLSHNFVLSTPRLSGIGTHSMDGHIWNPTITDICGNLIWRVQKTFLKVLLSPTIVNI